ncbi:MAG: DUF99 family protein [Candidatus Micrarchaeota archaeon]|nr:DUF99 family protein [Candidatus Micrarchaeota archaeon]
MMKGGIRILAVEDGPFTRKDKASLAVCLLGRDGIVEGMLSFMVAVDGDDATDKLLNAIRKSRFSGQVKMIAMNGITLGGLNIVDMTKLHASLKIPVIAITRKRPRRTLMLKTMKKYSGREKVGIFKDIAKNASLDRVDGFYVQSLGIKKSEIGKFMQTSLSLLRLGHIVASGIVKGESKGSL